ncbi:16256_t:CDS:1, partial [Dentiscutata erythropus]
IAIYYDNFHQKFEIFTNPINCVILINKNFESLQNATSICNASSFPEKDFLNIDQNYKDNSKGLDKYNSK